MAMNLEVIDHLLTTTRSVRRRLDLSRPIETEVIQECLEIAIQSPVGRNNPRYHFIVVTEPDKRARLAELYKKAFDLLITSEVLEVEQQRQAHNVKSWLHLVEHFHEVPVHIIVCAEGRPEGRSPAGLAGLYGNVQPAAWSLMLALRARGLGAAWTTIHIIFEKETNELLGIPDGITQGALLPVAYFTGDDFKPAKRVPASDRTYWNTWGNKNPLRGTL